MRIEDMSDIQVQEMILRWDIEYEQSYLRSCLDHEIHWTGTDEEYAQEIADAERRALEAEIKHYEFMQQHAEHFI